MRSALLLFLLLLASCVSNRDSSGSGLSASALSGRKPGLDVAEVALANGAPDTALLIAQRTLVADPNNVPALIMQANAQAALGQRNQAMRSFSQALGIAPADAGATIGLGRLKLATDPAAAAGLFLRVTTQDPHNIAALIDLGIANDLLGQHTEAQAAYRRALVIDPDRLAANVNLGLSLALSGDSQQALLILRPLALGPGTTPKIRQDLAMALALAGSNEEAAAILKTEMPQEDVQPTVTAYHLLQSEP